MHFGVHDAIEVVTLNDSCKFGNSKFPGLGKLAGTYDRHAETAFSGGTRSGHMGNSMDVDEVHCQAVGKMAPIRR